MKEKQILLTFDYELFLGKDSGSVDQCMILPTLKIQQILTKYDLQAVFFIDTTYLFRLLEESKTHRLASFDLLKITSQLKSLAEDGHLLFHHFHPHWLDAIYDVDTNTWDGSNHSRFALANLEIVEIQKIIDFSDDFLKTMYPKDKVPTYFGYRAGGLYSQPFDRLVPLFKQKNIKFDFSVLKGAISKGSTFGFDYTKALEINELIYSFEENNTTFDSNGFFIEYSMHNFSMNLFQRILNSIFYRLSSTKTTWQRYGDGNSSGNLVQSGKRAISSEETFSIELLNKVKAYYYYFYFKNNSIIHFISHPKLMSENSVTSFDFFLKLVHAKYKVNSQFNSLYK